mmetsp:Transcript_14622/g.42147  ORF Transcript_14622/g.42147 Transcript_14622/m.42147 type:complete len:750 (+) Transcript_14622:110-2359(+)
MAVVALQGLISFLAAPSAAAAFIHAPLREGRQRSWVRRRRARAGGGCGLVEGIATVGRRRRSITDLRAERGHHRKRSISDEVERYYDEMEEMASSYGSAAAPAHVRKGSRRLTRTVYEQEDWYEAEDDADDDVDSEALSSSSSSPLPSSVSADAASAPTLDQDEDELDIRHFEDAFELEDEIQLFCGSAEAIREQRRLYPGLDVIDKKPSSVAFNHVYVSAVPDYMMASLGGVFENFGVEFRQNFPDFEDVKVDAKTSLEELAAYKARYIYEVTGLPCVAERSGFEVEAVETGEGKNAMYVFNRLGLHVEKLTQNLLLSKSSMRRQGTFRTVLCYFDGQREIFESGEVSAALAILDLRKSLVSMSSAINNLMGALQADFELEFQPWMRHNVETNIDIQRQHKGFSLLRERLLREGRVLDEAEGILDVSSFLEAQVDIQLVTECAKELGPRLARYRPTKLLTDESGMVLAMPLAVQLQVPVVQAHHKGETSTAADSHQAIYTSRVHGGRVKELLVKKNLLSPADRVVVVDTFLSGGSKQDALLRIASQAGATPVSLACLLEKSYEQGRNFLSGYGVPIECLVKVTGVKDSQLILEDPLAPPEATLSPAASGAHLPREVADGQKSLSLVPEPRQAPSTGRSGRVTSSPSVSPRVPSSPSSPSHQSTRTTAARSPSGPEAVAVSKPPPSPSPTKAWSDVRALQPPVAAAAVADESAVVPLAGGGGSGGKQSGERAKGRGGKVEDLRQNNASQ